MIFGINMDGALELIKSSRVYSIGYRKHDGSYGEKKCKKYHSNSGQIISDQKNVQINHASKLKFIDESGKIFEIWTCLLVSVNDLLIRK